MIIDIVSMLKSERDAGDDTSEQTIERIDAHIRDLELLKAWIRDSASARRAAINAIVGEQPQAALEAAATPSVSAEAAPSHQDETRWT